MAGQSKSQPLLNALMPASNRLKHMALSPTHHRAMLKEEVFVLDTLFFNLNIAQHHLNSQACEDPSLEAPALDLQNLRIRTLHHVLQQDYTLALTLLQTMLHLVKHDKLDFLFDAELEAAPSETLTILIGLLANLLDENSLFDSEIHVPKGSEHVSAMTFRFLQLKERGESWISEQRSSSRALSGPSAFSSETCGQSAQKIIAEQRARLEERDVLVRELKTRVVERDLLIQEKDKEIAIKKAELAALSSYKRAYHSFYNKYAMYRTVLEEELENAKPRWLKKRQHLVKGQDAEKSKEGLARSASTTSVGTWKSWFVRANGR